MSDVFDRASDQEMMMREAAIAHARLPSSAHSYSHCCDCGDEIPHQRQAAVKGCRRCVSCQEAYERFK